MTLMLDWVPNTNHTGIFVAASKGYFEEAGLDVTIVQPGEVYAEAAVAGDQADFGISFQETVTMARADDVPIVSIAAILQHNTSGFASLSSQNIKTPADFVGLSYGAWGSPFEEPTLQVLMECAGVDYDKLEIVQVGWADPLALLAAEQVDLAWIFYGWQGFQAQQQGIDISIVMMEDYFDCIPDYYTPVIIASENTITGKPETASALLEALSKGYTWAAEHPGEAAEILVAAVPELDIELVKASQSWISDYYIADASHWGEQKQSVWQDYTKWMLDHGVIEKSIDVNAAFTNEFLP